MAMGSGHQQRRSAAGPERQANERRSDRLEQDCREHSRDPKACRHRPPSPRSCSLLPSLAWAADGGSDTGAFQRALAHGAFVALGASYVFGLATSLTPCVYPMIAITVSVFGAKEAKSRAQGLLLSLTFVLGIVALFTPMGVALGAHGQGLRQRARQPVGRRRPSRSSSSRSRRRSSGRSRSRSPRASTTASRASAARATAARSCSGSCAASSPRRASGRSSSACSAGSRRRATSRSAPRRWRSTGSASGRSSSSSARSP